MSNKIIRTICYFQKDPNEQTFQKLDELESLFKKSGFEVQTKRLCSPNIEKIIELDKTYSAKGYFLSTGTVDKDKIDILLRTNNIAFNYDLTNKEINLQDVDILFNIIKNAPAKTFNFTYVFNNPTSSPFFPAAHYENDGFTVGFQPTDLAEGCKTINEWLLKMKKTWFQSIDRLKIKKPIFIKMPISISNKEFVSLLNVISKYKIIKGVIIGNLFKDRNSLLLDRREVKKFKVGYFSSSKEPYGNVVSSIITSTFSKDSFIILSTN